MVGMPPVLRHLDLMWSRCACAWVVNVLLDARPYDMALKFIHNQCIVNTMQCNNENLGVMWSKGIDWRGIENPFLTYVLVACKMNPPLFFKVFLFLVDFL